MTTRTRYRLIATLMGCLLILGAADLWARGFGGGRGGRSAGQDRLGFVAAGDSLRNLRAKKASARYYGGSFESRILNR